MDVYRLLAGVPHDCRGRDHILPVLDCAFPPVKNNSENLFEDYEKRGGTMFFSRSRLEKHFCSPNTNTIEILLSCDCTRCLDSRGDGLTGESASDTVRGLRDGALLLGLMVYLGKLHFVYPWITSGIRDKPLHSAISQIDDEILATLFETPLERTLFCTIYERAIHMFDPVVFKIPTTTNLCPEDHYHDMRRFPFWREEEDMPQGSFGKITKFEILDEYIDESITKKMKDYSSSVTGYGSERKFVFAKKTLKISPITQRGLERDALRMVSQIEKPASDNIITLLAYYKWRKHIHFIFPYVATDLSLLLRNNECPKGLSATLGLGESLPDNWLWKQMVGVSRALSAIHTGMSNPFKNVRGQVIVLHFDLNPANILVTADGTLKITDFGQSIIRIVYEGDEMTSPINAGNPRYTPPESRPSTEAMKASLNENSDGIMVLLNYDVWSLACIMTEVLIHLLDRQRRSAQSSALSRFDQGLNTAPNGKRFFDHYGVKQCVKDALESFRTVFFHDPPANQYMNEVVDLLTEMFQHDKSHRCFSSQVIQRLDSAAVDYSAWRQRESDPLAMQVNDHGYKGDEGYKEIGFQDGKEILSFVKMDGITLEVVEQSTRQKRYRDKPCRIRVFKKPRARPPEFGLVWSVGGVNEATGILVNQRKIDTSKWSFIPTYLFQDLPIDQKKFDCVLFSTAQNDVALIFTFQSIQDVQTFQGTLLRKKVLPGSKLLIPKLTVKYTEQEGGVPFNQACIQFWTEDNPRFLRAARQAADSGSTATTTSSSSGTSIRNGYNSSASKAECEMMIVFLKDNYLLSVPLNNGQKQFRQVISQVVQILPRKSLRHKHFCGVWPPWTLPWRPEESDAALAMFGTPSIPLELGEHLDKSGNTQEKKIFRMEITLASKEDLTTLYQRTKKEWSK